MEKFSYVYMMGSTSRHALYTGVTAPLYLRVWQHKNNQGGYFTSKYKCYRLVYFEQFTNVEVAILREKEIKGCAEKNKLVESMNRAGKIWLQIGIQKAHEGRSSSLVNKKA